MIAEMCGAGGAEVCIVVDGWGSGYPHCPRITHWRRAGGDSTAQTTQGTAPLFFVVKEVWKQSVRGKGLSEVLWKSLQTHVVPSPLPLSPSPLLPALPFVCVTDYSPDSRK